MTTTTKRARRNPVTTLEGKVRYPERCTKAAAKELINRRKEDARAKRKKTARIGTCRPKDAAYKFHYGGRSYAFRMGPRKTKRPALHVGDTVATTLNGQRIHGAITSIAGTKATVAWKTGKADADKVVAKLGVSIYALRLIRRGKKATAKRGASARTAKRGASARSATQRSAVGVRAAAKKPRSARRNPSPPRKTRSMVAEWFPS